MTLQYKMHMIDATLIIYNMSREFGQSHLVDDKKEFGYHIGTMQPIGYVQKNDDDKRNSKNECSFSKYKCSLFYQQRKFG